MAVTIEPWYSQPAQVRFEFAASMGPQLYRCGNEPTLTRRSNGVKSFNGAATLSLRKCRADYRRRVSGLSWLQWGRNFIVAEIL